MDELAAGLDLSVDTLRQLDGLLPVLGHDPIREPRTVGPDVGHRLIEPADDPHGEERRRLEQFFDALQERPGQLGDAYLRDHEGRRVEVKYVGRFRVVYWVDHAVKEVKVLKLEPLTRQ